MRKGSNFSGTEKELEALMKDSLKHFISDEEWLSKMNESLPDQEYINICESLAECVDRGYFTDISYNVLMNKRIMFHPNKMTCTIVPEETSNEVVEKLRDSIDYKPYALTKAGEEFLGS